MQRPAGGPFIFAADVDPAACDNLQQIIAKTDVLQGIQVACRDFFDFAPGVPPAAGGVVVLNPPYGRRMGSRSKGKSLAMEIFRKLHADYRGWKLALILPKGYVEGRLPFAVQSRPLYHGGLKVVLLTGIVS
jgi:putative N6-adenine-specific DNA methylase